MKPHRWSIAAGMLATTIFAVPAWADPDFPAIPTQGSPQDSGAEGDTTEQDSAGAVASPQDCAVIKPVVSRLDAILARQTPLAQAFPAKEDGEKAIDYDLDLLNSTLPFIAYAETNVQDPAQRAKLTAYKNDLAQLSPLIAERKNQDMAAPAPFPWADQLAQTNNRAQADYIKIKDSCLT